MDDVLLLIIIILYIGLAVLSIKMACVLARCLFFRPVVSPINGEVIDPGVYAMDVPLQQRSRRQSMFEELNDAPSSDNPKVEPIGTIG